MKKKCTICNRVKGKRGCIRQNFDLICSRCCADIRNDECEECSYYRSSRNYNAAKAKKVEEKKFFVELNEEVELAVDRAMQFVERRRFKKAESILTDLLKDHPRNHMVLYGMGTFYAMQDQYDDAIKFYKKAVDIFPIFMEAYYNMGIAYKQKYDISNMLKSLRKSIDFGDPEDIQVRQAKNLIDSMEKLIRKNDKIDLDTYIRSQDEFDRANDLMEKGEWKKAIEGFKRSIQLNNTHVQPYGNLGICYAKIGKKEEAIAAFNKALEIDPSYELAIVNKQMTEQLNENERLEADLKITNYYQENRTNFKPF